MLWMWQGDSWCEDHHRTLLLPVRAKLVPVVHGAHGLGHWLMLRQGRPGCSYCKPSRTGCYNKLPYTYKTEWLGHGMSQKDLEEAKRLHCEQGCCWLVHWPLWPAVYKAMASTPKTKSGKSSTSIGAKIKQFLKRTTGRSQKPQQQQQQQQCESGAAAEGQEAQRKKSGIPKRIWSSGRTSISGHERQAKTQSSAASLGAKPGPFTDAPKRQGSKCKLRWQIPAFHCTPSQCHCQSQGENSHRLSPFCGRPSIWKCSQLLVFEGVSLHQCKDTDQLQRGLQREYTEWCLNT